MRRRLSLVIAFIGVLSLVGFAPVAQAGHDIKGPDKDGPHEHSPAPSVPQNGGDCQVIGEVLIGNANGDGGVPIPLLNTQKNHNHFFFNDVVIDCDNEKNPHYTGAFQVRAAGGTDGLGGQTKDAMGNCVGDKAPKAFTDCHGEDARVGWSHSSCYDEDADMGPGADAKAPLGCSPPATGPKGDIDDLYDGTKDNPLDGAIFQCTNCGEIEVESLNDQGQKDGRKDSVSTDNWVKFCRGLYDDGLGHVDLMAVPPVLTDCTNVPQGGEDQSTGGSNVLAWGQLNDWTDKGATDDVLCFLADLEFIPNNTVDTNGDELDDKIIGAQLVGTAQTWVTDGDNKDDCEGKKNEKK